jgi:tRNA-(ms[2]io[6]A)-hydroxylase
MGKAINNLEIILLDHSHCERKAAGVALNLMFRYPSYASLVRKLTAIAQEELEHFEQVNQWLDKWGIPLAPLNSPPYGAKLKAQIRHQEPDRLLDSLLISALIEARSHERLGLLAADYFERTVIEQRLETLAALESEILTTLHPEPRIHS